MKKYLFLLLLWCVSALSFAQDSLRMRIDSLLCDPMFETSQLGLMVYDLTADSVYYQHNARQLLRPASTMKLVTAITALDLLGPKYDFKTSIYYTGTIKNHTLVGNIYCVGGFDPTLTLEDVTDMALSIQQLGIDSISGKLIADRTMKEAVDYGEGWCWDDENPLLTPLSIGRKNIFLNTFAEEVARLGINLESVRLVEGQLPSNARHLTTIRHNITQVLDRMMKKSDNFYAEAVFYQTAASVRKPLAKASDAVGVTRKLLKRLGLNADSYRLADGSGLSLYNYISAELLCTLLKHAWNTPQIHDALWFSLPIAGVDGTLEKRMLNTAADGNVRAKTGTLTGISSLAGYCKAENGHQLCFSIINQGVMRNADGRGFQDRLCQVLCGEKEEVKEVKGVKGVKRAKPSARSAQKSRGRRR
jgi:D-alanyl-D-alanine carboxypeptidase/D-alanyl-D-alanine-endopeptidase (penicillin-binding protein 4)